MAADLVADIADELYHFTQFLMPMIDRFWEGILAPYQVKQDLRIFTKYSRFGDWRLVNGENL
jgi:hypothetical protein